MKTKNTDIIKLAVLSVFTLAGGNCLADEIYEYDASGNIISRIIDGKEDRLHYSGNRLVAIDSESGGSKLHLYDSIGRLTETESSLGGGKKQFVYGFSDKIVEIKSAAGNNKYYYNAFGDLIARKAEGSIHTYIWDGISLVADEENTYINEAHPSGGIPVLANGDELMVSDYLGNTLLKGAQTFKPTAFGEGLKGGQFTGRPYVEGIDAHVFRHRYYSPAMARWTSPDPSGYPEGLNRYEYVKSDPASNIDALGLATSWSATTTNSVSSLGPNVFGLTTTSLDGFPGSHDVWPSDECFAPHHYSNALFSGSNHIDYVGPGNLVSGGSTWSAMVDFTFAVCILVHENWHATHAKTASSVTVDEFENWWANYSGNEFGDESGADSAGQTDSVNGFNKAMAKMTSLMARSHPGHKYSAQTTYTISGSPWDFWRTDNYDWGQQLDDELALETITFSMTEGNCEQ